MSVRRSLIVLTVLVLVLPTIAFSLRANQINRANRAAPNLQFYTVERGTLENTVSALGTIEAEAVARLSFTAPGRVAEVLVKPGDYVLAGDVLVRQADVSQRNAYEQALLALQTAQLRQEQLLQPVDEAQVRIAEANLNSALGAYAAVQNAVSADQLRAAELRVEQARQAKEDAIRARTTASGGQPDEYYSILDAQVGAASFNEEIARLQLESLRTSNRDQLAVAGARVAQAQRELERVKAGPTQAELDRAAIAIRQAEAQVQQAERALARTALTAPFDGVVSLVNAEVGALTAPGTPVVEIVDVTPLRLNVQIDEVDVRQVSEGMPVRVQLDALPGVRFPAAVAQIALVGRNDNGIISYEARLQFDPDDPRVRVGMTADAAILVEERRDVLIVPNQYIRLDRQTGQAFVNLVLSDGSLEEIAIELGLRGQDASEVLAGLEVGDVIAVALQGASRLPGFGG